MKLNEWSERTEWISWRIYCEVENFLVDFRYSSIDSLLSVELRRGNYEWVNYDGTPLLLRLNAYISSYLNHSLISLYSSTNWKCSLLLLLFVLFPFNVVEPTSCCCAWLQFYFNECISYTIFMFKCSINSIFLLAKATVYMPFIRCTGKYMCAT